MSVAEPPPQPSVPLQRAAGRVAVSVRSDGGRTRLGRLHQSGCLKLRFPRLPDGALEGVLINTAGGLTGGDRLDQQYDIGASGALVVTTQAAERIYRATSDTATVAARITVGEDASLRYLPQETILFDGGRLTRRLDIDVAATSRLLVCESVILGRTLMGETVRSGLFRDSWRIRRGSRLVFAEEARLGGDIDALVRRQAVLGGNRAFATVVAQGAAAEGALDEVRRLAGTTGGASLVDGLLVARLVASSGFELRKRLVPILIALANGALPRVWSL